VVQEHRTTWACRTFSRRRVAGLGQKTLGAWAGVAEAGHASFQLCHLRICHGYAAGSKWYFFFEWNGIL